MIEYMLVGLVSGLIVFFALFIVSFLIIGLISGFIHLILFGFNGFPLGKPSAYREQTA